MNTARYMPQDDAEPPEGREPELQDRYPVTHDEKVIMGLNAVTAGLGTTSGIIAEGLWFATTDVLSGGLGVGMYGATAVGVISAVGVVSAIASIPIAYLTYRELMLEAETLTQHLKEEAQKRKEFHEKIFFELLLLRCLYDNEKCFAIHAKRLLKNAKIEVEEENLIHQVQRVYEHYEHREFHVSWRYADNMPPLLRESKLGESKQTLIEILRNPNITMHDETRCQILSKVTTHAIIESGFKPVITPPAGREWLAAGVGMIAGLSVSGFSLGTSWAFGALVVTAGLAAAVPVAGWAALAVTSIVLGVMFGLGVGLCKQKNLQRKKLNEVVTSRNAVLQATEQSVRRGRSIKQEMDRQQVRHTKGTVMDESLQHAPELQQACSSDESHTLSMSRRVSRIW